MTLYVQLDPGAQAPERQTPGAAGYDLACNEPHPVTLFPGEYRLFSTGVRMAMPPGCAGIIMPRSGWAVKAGLDKLAGLIDSDYRGEIKVLLINHGSRAQEINPGDRIAQLVVVEHYSFPVRVVESLDATERNESGFGSTGIS